MTVEVRIGNVSVDRGRGYGGRVIRCFIPYMLAPLVFQNRNEGDVLQTAYDKDLTVVGLHRRRSTT